MAALGERFRAAREARGLSLSDVAEQIRIRSVYLGAIEDEHWSAIGAPVYARGFLRTYARFLGLDPEEVVAEFNRTSGAGSPPVDSGGSVPGYSGAAASRNLSPLIWIASLVAIVLIAFVFYNAFTMRARAPVVTAALPTYSPNAPSSSVSDVPAAVATSSASALAASPGSTQAPSPAASASPPTRTIELRLSAPSWVRVDVDGSVSMEGTFPAGTSRAFHGKNVLLRIGNAGGVDVIVDGKDIGKLGATGDVVERSFTL